MTSDYPIDLDHTEAAVLIDFENIRLSWEKMYQRQFRYLDLCWLCELVEVKFRVSIGKIVVFMSLPSQNNCCTHYQKIRQIYALLKEDQDHSSKNTNVKDHGAGAVKKTPVDLTTLCNKPCQDQTAAHIRLGKEVCRFAEVCVRIFGYKLSKGRRTQRCCDVAIGSEVTKICFMPRFTTIYLFSADSDFDETVKSCAEAENIGGAIKYAKSIKIFGFSHAFELNTLKAVQKSYNHNKMSRMLKIEKDTTDVQIYFLDYEFPLLQQVKNSLPSLQCKCYEDKTPCTPNSPKIIVHTEDNVLKKVPPWRCNSAKKQKGIHNIGKSSKEHADSVVEISSDSNDSN